MLESFEEGDVLSDIVVLIANPLGDAGGFAVRALNHNANAGGAGVPVRPAVDVGYQIGHSAPN